MKTTNNKDKRSAAQTMADKKQEQSSKIDISLLETLYSIHAPSYYEDDMLNYVSDYLTLCGAAVNMDKKGNIYATCGQAKNYPVLVAHADEVHDSRGKDFICPVIGNTIHGYDLKKDQFTGIGADDKNGIYIILKMAEAGATFKAAIFISEEVGCMGSQMADMSFFDNALYVIQIDRKGSDDFITDAGGVELCTNDFVNACNIKKYGYKKTAGMMTDVMQLKENGLSVSACNISAGYYRPHTDDEYTNLADLQNCFDFVEYIISNVKDRYPHKYVHIPYSGHNYKMDYNNTYDTPYKADKYGYIPDPKYDEYNRPIYKDYEDWENQTDAPYQTAYDIIHEYIFANDYASVSTNILTRADAEAALKDTIKELETQMAAIGDNADRIKASFRSAYMDITGETCPI